MLRALFGLVIVMLAGAFSFAASTNDSFASRIVLRGSLPTGSGSFSGAATEPGEPHSYRASLWWEWTPAFNGGVYLTTMGTPGRPAALVYTGTWPNLTLVSGPRPSSAFIQPSNVSFYARSNLTVYIALAAHPDSTLGTVSLRTLPVASSDDFSRATQLSSTNLISTTPGQASTLEPGEIPSSTNIAGTFWWKWNLPATGRYLMQLSAQNAESASPNLALYQGTSLTNLSRLAFASRDLATRNSRVVLDLAPGVYYIAAEDLGYHTGAALMIRSSPPNDDFSSRILFPSEAEISVTFNPIGATREAAEQPTTNSSVWWEWTAPVTGSVALEVSSSAINWTPAIEVFQGTELTNLIRLLPTGVEVPTRFAALRAIAGQTYVFRVTVPYYAAGGVGISLRPGAFNDDFANAVVLEGNSIQTNAAPPGATFEAGEPRPSDVGGGSIWWTWTPTNSGAYSIEASKGGLLSPVNVYRGDALTNLTLVTNHSQAEANPVAVRLQAGQPVYIQVFVAASDTQDVVLTIQPGPANDDFANALPIASDQTVGSSRGATSELSEPLGGGLGHTVWYQWQPTNTAGYEITIGNSAVLSFYSGDTLTNLTLVGRLTETNSSGAFFTQAARIYYIALDSTVPGGAPVSFRIAQGPENDTFANRTTIETTGVWVEGTSLGATREADEPLHDASNIPSRTAWFEWTAQDTGGFYIEVWESLSPSARFAIYQGIELTNLISVPSYDHTSGGTGTYQRYIAFRAIEGQKYLLALFDDVPRDSEFIIRKGPQHDEFANARELVLGTPFDAVTTGATLQPEEPATNIATGTLWHRFTAPTNGTYVASGQPLFTVYRGTNLADLAEIERPNFPFPFLFVPFRAVAGETIYIAVVVGFPSSYAVRIDPAVPNDDFANATELTSVLSLQNPAWSTIEPGEPVYPTNYSATVWWRWKPASKGLYRVAAFTGHQSAYLGIYRGTNLADLTLQASVSASFGETLIAELEAQAGLEFSIVLAHLPMSGSHASIAIYQPAENDDFSSPLIIGNHPVTNAFSFASAEPGEPDAGFETVWYSWTAPTTDSFVFKPMTDYNFPSFLRVYTGSALTNLTTVAEVVGSMGGFPQTPSLAFRAVEGATYRIAVGFERSTVDHKIFPSVEPGHVNDDFTERAQLSGQFLAWNSTTIGATTEPVEEAIVREAGAFPASIWAEWTVPSSGIYKLVARPFNLQPMSIRIFRGDSLEQLQELGSSSGPNMATFSAEAGETYRIRIASAALSVGFFSFRLGPLAVNESAATATPLEGTEVAVIGQNWTAISALNPVPSTMGAIWYSWTAPANGFLTYWTAKTNLASVAVFHTRTPTFSSNVTARAAQGWEPPGSTMAATVAVTGGMTYLFQVISTASTNSSLNLFFEEDTVQTTLEGALLGGAELWRLQPNVFASGPDALEAAPLSFRDEAWIEFVFNRPGTLRFKSKVLRDGSVLFSRTLPFSPGATFTISQPHDWTQRSLNLRAATNVVRLTFTGSSDLPLPTSIAWLDDFEFEPLTAPPLRVEFDSANPETVTLSLDIEPQRVVLLDVSSNLIDWEPWTNAISATATTRAINIQTLTNDLLFFRSRVLP